MSLLDLPSNHISKQWLNHILQQISPITLPNSFHISQELPISGYKSLNVIARYANHLKISVREQIQNWRDQCLSVAKQQNSNFKLENIKVHSYIDNNTKCFMMYCSVLCKVLGFIISTKIGDKYNLEFCNYATILNPNILQFGRTTKESSDIFAGNFGEGMKVEINRLVSEGTDIYFCTGNSIWHFYHNKESELFVEYSSNNQWLINTHIIMKNAPLIDNINQNDYIFLLDKKMSYISDSIEFLFDDEMINRIFLLGIFVMNATDHLLPKIGINFIKKSVVTIGRDRNSISNYSTTDAIQKALDSLPRLQNCSHLPNLNETCRNCLLFRILYIFYDFHKQKNIDSSWTFTVSSLKFKVLAENMVDIFLYIESSDAVPILISGKNSKFQSNAKLFKIKLIEVSEFMLKILQKSKRCPSMKDIVQSRAEAFCALPELIIQKDEFIPYKDKVISITVFPEDYAKIAMQIRVIAETVFNKYLKAIHIRFKDCSIHAKDNSSKIININIKGEDYFLFDFRYFVLDKVHEYNKKKEFDFTCTDDICGCVLTFACESLMSSLKALHNINKKELRRKIMRFSMKKYGTNVQTEVNSIKLPNEIDNETNSISKTNYNTKANKTQNKNSTQPKHTYSIRDKQYTKKGYEYSKVKSDIGNNCIDKTNISKPKTSLTGLNNIIHPNTDIPVPMNCNNEGKTYICSSYIGNIPFVIEQSSSQASTPDNAYILEKIISSLALNVFNIKIKRQEYNTLDKLNIYYNDKTTTIAFNLDSKLFFNCYYYDIKEDIKTNLCFWFSVFCHELAHNEESSHNEIHSYIMTVLHKTYMPVFVTYCSNISR